MTVSSRVRLLYRGASAVNVWEPKLSINVLPELIPAVCPSIRKIAFGGDNVMTNRPK